VRPGAVLPVTVLIAVPGSRNSALGMLAAEPAGGRNACEQERHSSGGIQTVALVEERPIALHDLETFLNLLKRAVGPKLLCLTGLVALADDPDRPLVLHAGQIAYPLQRLATWPSDDRRTRMIVITHDLEPTTLQRLFASVTGPWPDRTRIRVAMAAIAALVMVLAAGLAVALRPNASATMEASSTAPWTQDHDF
jgi:Cobalamin synthesis protein cobW C-terminal domain